MRLSLKYKNYGKPVEFSMLLIYIFKPHLISFIYSHFVQFDYCRQQNFGLSAITDCARVYIGNLKCHVISTPNEYLSFLDYRNYDK
jgi:hypothetical protein